jgi:hypothetical protein
MSSKAKRPFGYTPSRPSRSLRRKAPEVARVLEERLQAAAVSKAVLRVRNLK